MDNSAKGSISQGVNIYSIKYTLDNIYCSWYTGFMKKSVGTLCSGIDGVGTQAAGLDLAWGIEIDPELAEIGNAVPPLGVEKIFRGLLDVL